jgi:hypothetical protein
MKPSLSNLVSLITLSFVVSASAQADIVKCTSTLAGATQNLVAFIQRDASTASMPTNDVVLVQTGTPAITLGHFKTGSGASEVGYDVDEGIRLFVSKAVEKDQDSAKRIVMGREMKSIDDLHIFWPQTSNFETTPQFYTQIRADVKSSAKEYNGSLANADDKPLSLRNKNVEPTSYSLNCAKIDASQSTPNGKLDAQGNFTNLEDIHDWALTQTN